MKEFFVKKQSNTYAEMLEAFGLAKLLYSIQDTNGGVVEVSIESQNDRYKISSKRDITAGTIENKAYFAVLPFIVKDKLKTPPPTGAGSEFDYVDQKKAVDYFKERLKKISEDKNIGEADKKILKKQLEEERLGEFSKKIKTEFDVVRELIKNPYTAYNKAFSNFYDNRQGEKNEKPFVELLKLILNNYSDEPFPISQVKLNLTEQITSQQLFSPHQGKGLNKSKANNASMGNLSSSWINEAMKMSGALGLMICQYVKVGTGYDLKIYVPEIRQGNIYRWLYESGGKNGILFNFKKYLKSGTPVKLDILNLINLVSLYIEKSPEFKGKVKECLGGLHSVYQKDLGQNKAVANISFIETPSFVEYSNKSEGEEWIDWLGNQKSLIRGIEEKGDAMQGLLSYRNFLSGSDLESFFSFSYWYSAYLMQALSNEKYWVRPFLIKDLNKIFQAMDKSLSTIINNEGFQAIAKAIRQSTVRLQYVKDKSVRKFDVRYGLAQRLKNKSTSSTELAAFIGDFVGTYNAETARYRELRPEDQFIRANVKDNELTEFFKLLDEYSPKLVGAMLSAYGYALTKKEAPDTEPESPEDENENESENN